MEKSSINYNYLFCSIIFILIVALIFEINDLRSGRAFKNSDPKITDTTDDILNKITIAATSEGKYTQWRRSYIFSFFITLIIFNVIFQKSLLLNCRDVFISIIFLWIMFTAFQSFYYHHYFIGAEQNILKSIKLIKGRQ